MKTVPPPHRPVRPGWLASRREAPIEPEREPVDAPHHLRDRPATNGRYLLPDLLADIAGDCPVPVDGLGAWVITIVS